jgi:CHASE2 domain-containing sensor protein
VKFRSPLKFLIIAAVAVGPILEGVGLFGRWEGGISTLVATWKRHESSEVVIIGIDRYDYTHLFHSKSPLTPESLYRIINGALESGAVRIGVDLDTSDPAYEKLAALSRDPRLVWAQAAEYSHVNHRYYRRGSPLGGASDSLNSGLSIASADQDGVVRRYQQSYEEIPDDVSGPGAARQFLASLPAKLAGTPDVANTEDILIDYRTRERYQYSASALLGDRGAEIRTKLKGKIVLIGDVYDSRDEHQTPLGWKNGVYILADAVDTEIGGLAGRRFRAPSRWLTLACMVILAGATWFVCRWCSGSVFKFVVYGFLLLLLMLFASWWAYGSLINSLYFVPTVLAISCMPVFEMVKARWKKVKPHLKQRNRSVAIRDHAAEANRVGSAGINRADK